MQRSLLKSGYRLTRLLTKLKAKPSSVLILTHDYPDPDALASAYALHFLLAKGFHIPSRIVYGGRISRVENKAMVHHLKIPVHKLSRGDLLQYQEIALVDTQPEFRNNSFPKNRKAFLVIDQHLAPKKPNAHHAIIDTECGASCVILAEACLLLNLDLPTAVATALAYGILSDTLNLYRVRRKDVIQTYLAILPKADMKLLAQMQNPPRPGHFFVTLAQGIQQAQVCRRLIFSQLGLVQSPDVVAQMADLLLTYQGMRFSLATGRYKRRLQISLRMREGEGEAHELLRAILETGEAGGHDTIAGGSFEVSGSWEEAERGLIQRLFKKLRWKDSPTKVATPFQIGAK